MCPANSWHHAKDLLHAEVKILLGILRHKKLSIKEYCYIVQSVLISKLRYYLTVVPMTNRELDHIDAQIIAVLKRNIGAAISTSSPLLHMDASTSTGLSFPSIRDIRTTSLIEKAYLILNSDTLLGRITRARTINLRDTLGWTMSPLANPARASPHIWHTHWMSRVMHLLWETSSSIKGTDGLLSRPTDRT
jgi:hypothetical protein